MLNGKNHRAGACGDISVFFGFNEPTTLHHPFPGHDDVDIFSALQRSASKYISSAVRAPDGCRCVNSDDGRIETKKKTEKHVLSFCRFKFGGKFS